MAHRFSTCRVQGHVQSENVVHHFATVSGLNNMLPPNGEQQTFRYVFSRLVGVPQVLPNPQRCVYKRAMLKMQCTQWILEWCLTKCSR